VAATPGIRFEPIRSSMESDAAAFGRFEDRVARMDLRPNRGSVFSAHQMGTVRMGAAPRDHPCDPNGRVRARGRRDRLIGGLYVADASLVPTALGINPMLTVMALARRVARTVLAES
jgi:choline dehydrogenase-like flavoprotein